MSPSLQIVAFDNPNPPDYGGAVEVFHKLKSLYDLGVKIDLHVFIYGKRREFAVLEEMCRQVFYYDRNTTPATTLSKRPYIVASRENSELLTNLADSPAPILFEGLHTCGFLHREELKDHFRMVRTHNVEHEYYAGLAKGGSTLMRKAYYRLEAKKLVDFEKQLSHADVILAITESDADHFSRYGRSVWLPPFSRTYSAEKPGGDFALFHGNLAVSENHRAAMFLIDEVFSKMTRPFVIAGKQPGPQLVRAVRSHKHITLVADPDSATMNRLLLQAKCHVFHTDQNTGIKLKFIHAIQTGGHIVLNGKMLFDPRYADEVELAETGAEYISRIEECLQSEEAKPRERLRSLFDNAENARKIVDLLKEGKKRTETGSLDKG